MGVLTPWCPRCGAWRGHMQAGLCKGCQKIDKEVTEQFPTPFDGPPEERVEYEKNRREVLATKVQERFIKISEMRTDREAFTQSLEEMVEQHIEEMKRLCYAWMRMRAESRRVRFANMYAIELVTTARAALEELGSVSLELTKYTENKAVHEERMQRVISGMQAVEKFMFPDGNEPEAPVDPEASDDDMPPDATE